MQALEVTYRESAATDIQNIFDTILKASQNLTVADRFISRIARRCERIGHVPYGGRPRNDLEEGLRTVPFEHSAIIAYRVEGDCVEIVNVFYGGRDYEAFYVGAISPDDETENTV